MPSAEAAARYKARMGPDLHGLLLLGLSWDSPASIFQPFQRASKGLQPRFLGANASDESYGLLVPKPSAAMVRHSTDLVISGNARAYELSRPQWTAILANPRMDYAVMKEESYARLHTLPPGSLQSATSPPAVTSTPGSTATEELATGADVSTTEGANSTALVLLSLATPSLQGSSPDPLSPVPEEEDVDVGNSNRETSSPAMPTSSTTWQYPGFYMRSCFLPDNDTSLKVTRADLIQLYDYSRLTIRFCPKQCLTPEIKTLAVSAYRKLIAYIDGTSGFYPPGYRLGIGLTLDSSAKGRAWFSAHERDLARSGNNYAASQILADSFSEEMGVTRIHAVDFFDRRPDPPTSRPPSHGYDGFVEYSFAFLLLIDMIHHPPRWTDPDAVFTLRTLDYRELAIILNRARTELGGSMRRTVTMWEKAKAQIKALKWPQERLEAWQTLLINLRPGPGRWEESRMAAGGRTDGPILSFDAKDYDFLPRQIDSSIPPSYHLDGNWTVFDLPLPHGGPAESAPTAPGPDSDPRWGREVLQANDVAAPLCGIAIKGMRTSNFGQPPIPSDVDLEASMTPRYKPASPMFARVMITRAAFRECDEGEVELSLVFASAAHAAIAWHTSHTWIPLLDMELPEAVLTSDIAGDRHPLCQLVFSIHSWPGSPCIWEFQRAFGHPSLPALAASARVLHRSRTPAHDRDVDGKLVPLDTRRIRRSAEIRTTYASPQEAAKMIGITIPVFAKGTSLHYSQPGHLHIAAKPIEICANCAHLGHDADHCPLPACGTCGSTSHTALSCTARLTDNTATDQPPTPLRCRTCTLISDHTPCGDEHCQLAGEADRNTALMIAAVVGTSSTEGPLSRRQQHFLNQLFRPSN